MTRPRLLDLFCGQGGAGAGYWYAGFDVVGVDIAAQPRYPYPLTFIQGDALEYLAAHGHEFDAIHASPPCQAFTRAQRIRSREHPDLIGPTRRALARLNRPWVIENVPGAPLRNPAELCGAMFELRTYRHRLFETSFEWTPPRHKTHLWPVAKLGRPPGPDEFMEAVGNFSGVEQARAAMDCGWMSREGLREAVPPAFTELIGGRLLLAVR